MTDLEIPFEKDRRGHYRFFEMLPGMLSWTMLALPFILSFINIRLAALFMFVYILINFSRGMAGAIRSMQGYHTMREHRKLPWPAMLKELALGEVPAQAKRPQWHAYAISQAKERSLLIVESRATCYYNHRSVCRSLLESEGQLVATEPCVGRCCFQRLPLPSCWSQFQPCVKHIKNGRSTKKSRAYNRR